MDKIAVLIPCYNESQTIEKVVTDWRRELPEAVIYVYDNNSTDHTDDILYAPDCIYHNGKYYLYYCLASRDENESHTRRFHHA